MKGFRIIALLALLDASHAKASDGGVTNRVPAHVRNLLDSAGYDVAQKTISLPRQFAHSFRNPHFIIPGPFAPLVVPVKKTNWNLWDNSSFKSVGREGEQINVFDPYAVLARYEYDITYSFDF